MTDIVLGYFPVRAAPAGGPVPPLFSPPSAPWVPLPESLVTDTWEGSQSTQGFVLLATAEAEILRFSGFPDRIEVTVLDNDAVIRFTDEQRRPIQEITVLAGTFKEPNIRARAVQARNATAGMVARVQVVGKWRTR
jgi:hypothetical protein